VSVSRTSTPTLIPGENRVDVHFSVDVAKVKDLSKRAHFEEDYPMRYLFLPEIRALSHGLFELRDAKAWRFERQPALEDHRLQQMLPLIT
jgi:hypothetical protein